MEQNAEKPPWKQIVFYKTKPYTKSSIEFGDFLLDIPKELYEKKNEINAYEEEHRWELAKKLANPYEMVYTHEEKFPYPNISLVKPLSRSYFKLIEILKGTDFLKDIPKEVQFLRSAHVAEGPGGFIQGFIDLVEESKRKVKRIDAITLRSDKQHVPGWKKASNFLKKYSHIINISYGSDNSGDIYNLENQEHFINTVPQKVHLFTADGGFDFSIDYSLQEKNIFTLLVSSFIIGLQVLTINGYCIIKLFDTYSESTETIISLCGSCFKEYALYKPAASRPCNSERYFIGKKYRGINSEVIHVLKIIYSNTKNSLYPKISLLNEEKEYINSISKLYEKKQIECIDLAKQLAENQELYKNYYKDFYSASLKFCTEFRIPTKIINLSS
jgi:23S rRNA U2552 (ribose-2'-O)-methylase RlmE/FtsJ